MKQSDMVGPGQAMVVVVKLVVVLAFHFDDPSLNTAKVHKGTTLGLFFVSFWSSSNKHQYNFDNKLM